MLLHALADSPTHAAAVTPTAASLVVPAAVHAIARACAAELRRHLQLTLFGFDLIQACDTNDPAHRSIDDVATSSSSSASTPAAAAAAAAAADYFLIDINYFPSYKSLTDLPHKLITICLKQRGKTRTDHDG
jgi:hypothetical protein